MRAVVWTSKSRQGDVAKLNRGAGFGCKASSLIVCALHVDSKALAIDRVHRRPQKLIPGSRGDSDEHKWLADKATRTREGQIPCSHWLRRDAVGYDTVKPELHTVAEPTLTAALSGFIADTPGALASVSFQSLRECASGLVFPASVRRSRRFPACCP